VPGFAYLGELDERLRLLRRDAPRPRVPAGAVAIAGGQTAVYPFATPGGWHLIGRTGTVMFDPRRDPAALLAVGARVRFVPT
jgi:KipI family sensor histidine kinase inhibitor